METRNNSSFFKKRWRKADRQKILFQYRMRYCSEAFGFLFVYFSVLLLLFNFSFSKMERSIFFDIHLSTGILCKLHPYCFHPELTLPILEANSLAFTSCYAFTIQRQLKIQSNDLELFHTGRIYEASLFLKAFFYYMTCYHTQGLAPIIRIKPCVLLPNSWLQIHSKIMLFRGTIKTEMQRATEWPVRHRNVLLLLRPLSFPTLETVFPLCFLLDNGQLAGPQIQQLGPFHSRAIVNIA